MEDLIKIVFSVGVFIFYIWRSFAKQQQEAKQRQKQLTNESIDDKKRKWEELFEEPTVPTPVVLETVRPKEERARKSFLYKDKYSKNKAALSLESVDSDYFKNLQNDSNFEMQRMMLDDEQHEEDFRSAYITDLVRHFRRSPADAIIYDAILKPKYLE